MASSTTCSSSGGEDAEGAPLTKKYGAGSNIPERLDRRRVLLSQGPGSFSPVPFLFPGSSQRREEGVRSFRQGATRARGAGAGGVRASEGFTISVTT